MNGRKLVFDIESDGLLDSITRIWCIVVMDADTDEMFSFGPDQIHEALRLLDTADTLVAHNGIGFDLPALEKVVQWKPRAGVEIIDTLVLARLCHSDQKDLDMDSKRSHIEKLAGSHSLEAWGIRLGLRKGSYGDTEGAWDAFNSDMMEYCQRDVELNLRLLRHLERDAPPKGAIQLEMSVAMYAEECNRRGWKFDLDAADELLKRLKTRQGELRKELVELFPLPSEEMKTPAYYEIIVNDRGIQRFPTKGEADKWRKSNGLKPKEVKIVPGPPKRRVIEFNPNSTKQIAEQLYERYQWVSPELTDTGLEKLDSKEGEYEDLVLTYPKITEEILETLRFPEAPKLVEFKMLTKRISMLESGTSAWLKCVSEDGRIRYRLISLGTVTHRMAMRAPNLSQVTGVGKPYGEECRSLFVASDGYVEVGIDLSGIEARLLAHFLYSYDRGKFGDLVLNGDFHQYNADNIGLDRSPTKNVFYGWAYGAGDIKIGRMVVSNSEEWKEQYDDLVRKYTKKEATNVASKRAYRTVGKEIRTRLEEGITGLPQLLLDVKVSAQRGYLSPLDGRRIPVRSEHSALNTLLQGSAAIVAKRWLSSSMDVVRKRKLDSHMLIFSHDEVQSDVRPDHVDQHIDIFMRGIKYTEKFYSIKIPLDGEAKVGSNWCETH